MKITVKLTPDTVKMRPGVRAILGRLDQYDDLIREYPTRKRSGHVALTVSDYDELLAALRGGLLVWPFATNKQTGLPMLPLAPLARSGHLRLQYRGYELTTVDEINRRAIQRERAA